MRVLAALAGFFLLVIVLADAVETVVVARHGRRFSWLAGTFFRASWASHRSIARLIGSAARREHFLGLYGPVSLLLLLGLWASAMVIAFALLQWSTGLELNGVSASLAQTIYFSAASFFTLGFVEPNPLYARYIMVFEAATGFSFLGLVIGYLPVLYQSFSSRELRILLLDARAGSPPSATTLLLRSAIDPMKLEQRLAGWEEWALDLLQTHLSYPMLTYYRSLHANQSWLAALTVVADLSALTAISAEGDLKSQAEFTFAASRHALVHTASVFRLAPCPDARDRLPKQDASRLCALLATNDAPIRPEFDRMNELAKLRDSYEPFASALSSYLSMELPAWLPSEATIENWKRTSWRS